MSKTDSLHKIEILGVPVTTFRSYNHAVETAINRIKHKKKTFCVAINPIKIYSAQSDERLLKIIGSAHLHLCDGFGAVIAGIILHGRLIKRITGVEFFQNLIEKAEKEQLKVFLLGASEDTNRKAVENLQKSNPNLQLVGRQSGYFNSSDRVVEKINCSGADILFVAMGSPKQEYWIYEHMDAISATLIMGIGGTLDVASGRIKRAPKIFRSTGTEFLYRLVMQPKRWRRQTALPKFAILVIKSWFANALGHRRYVPKSTEYCNED